MSINSKCKILLFGLCSRELCAYSDRCEPLNGSKSKVERLRADHDDDVDRIVHLCHRKYGMSIYEPFCVFTSGAVLRDNTQRSDGVPAALNYLRINENPN